MNKLIIIGNGFDLHHGLHSDYKSFLKWFISDMCKEGVLHGKSSRLGLSLTFEKGFNGSFLKKVTSCGELAEIIFNDEINLQKVLFELQGESFRVSCVKSDGFMTGLLEYFGNMNWVDVEMFYYNHLRKILKDIKFRPEHETVRLLDDVNAQLNLLKSKLIEYLKTIDRDSANLKFSKLTEEDIQTRPILERHHIDKTKELYPESVSKNEDLITPNKILVVSFNYTSLIHGLDRNSKVTKMNIHGAIDSRWNNPIFGYGDEIDEDYILMERTNINQFFENIKSFGYFNNTNYSHLSRFIEDDSFVVYTWGHSCGLSDRTLLNYIFEHDNCTGIKPFYWVKKDGDDNYIELTQNISRHFKNKLKMRKRVFNKEDCEAL